MKNLKQILVAIIIIIVDLFFYKQSAKRTYFARWEAVLCC
jgi:hypothetical protein